MTVRDRNAVASAAPLMPASSTTVAVTGVVLRPDGTPAAGASVFAIRSIRADRGGQTLSTEIVARTTAALDGAFQTSMPSQSERALGNSGIENGALQIVATAAGYGLAWQPVLAAAPDKPFKLQLVADSTPIEGRILNLEGQAVAGARLRVIEILEPNPAALDNWFASVRAAAPSAPAHMTKATSFMPATGGITPFPGGKVIHPPSLPDLSAVTTDGQGRFHISGLGANRKVTLALDGPAIATSWIAVLTRDIPRVPLTFADPRYRVPYYFGSKFDFPAEPTQIVEGIVRDADSRQPLAGVEVFVRRLGGSTLMADSFVSVKTDAAGRYRLVGLPKPPAGEANVLLVVPEKSQPYFRSEIDVPSASGLEPVTCEIDLKAAVWLSGRVTDKTSGQGIPSVVSYYPFLDIPTPRHTPTSTRASNPSGRMISLLRMRTVCFASRHFPATV